MSQGNFRADLRSEEFQSFLEETQGLQQALEGTAQFTTMEEQVALTLAADGKGHVRVSGEARHEPGSGNRLQFEFALDRTALPSICRSLEQLLAAFPVMDGPEVQ